MRTGSSGKSLFCNTCNTCSTPSGNLREFAPIAPPPPKWSFRDLGGANPAFSGGEMLQVLQVLQWPGHLAGGNQ